MSKKLCLQWNDFNENVNSAFWKLRDNKEFTDVTLICEDGQQIESHKVMLASLSPFFQKILHTSKHPHPLIYLKGCASNDFASILDFPYFGEAKAYQEDLDSFLAIAEEIKLKGVTGQNSSELLEEQEKSPEPTPFKRDLPQNSNAPIRSSAAVAIPNQPGTDLQALDDKVKSMIEKSENMIPVGGKNRNGTPMQARSSICKVCGKEGTFTHLKNHVESNHLEGISIPCDHCGKICPSRTSLGMHKSRYHK